MRNRYHLQLYWPGRIETLSEMSAKLYALFTSLASVHPGLANFFVNGKRAVATSLVDSEMACQEALLEGKILWKTGHQERTSYEQRFAVERRMAPAVALTITCGIEPLGLDPIWTPNRLSLFVRAEPGDERASRPVLEAALRCAILVFKPDWAYAGTEAVPDPPKVLFSDGTPRVGWMLYLRSGFPSVPRTLPPPAVAYPLRDLGTLIVTHPELFHEQEPEQLASIERVRRALNEAGVLVPPSHLRPA